MKPVKWEQDVKRLLDICREIRPELKKAALKQNMVGWRAEKYTLRNYQWRLAFYRMKREHAKQLKAATENAWHEGYDAGYSGSPWNDD